MKISLKPFYGKVFKNNALFNLNNGDNVFYGFKEKIKKKGVEINTMDVDMDSSDYDVYCDIPFPWEINTWVRLLTNRRKSILFCFESPLVNPFSHRYIIYKLFKKVYTWNDLVVNNKDIKKFCIPALNFNLRRKIVPFKKKKLLVLINSNIAVPYPFLILSPFKNELYPERLKAIDYFESAIPKDFHLFGRGWNAPKKFSLVERLLSNRKYTSFRGAISRDSSSKVGILSHYKFNLCFENCRADGYISEKIIDCLKAHTVPIYYGAPNIQKYVPKNCYIDYRDFKDYKSLCKFISSMNESEYNEYIENGIRYMKENFDKYWSEEKFMKTFLEAISFKY